MVGKGMEEHRVLHRWVGIGGRLGGIWGYAAVCAITGQGGIILGRYYWGHSVWELLQPAPFNRPPALEKKRVLAGEHLINKATRGGPVDWGNQLTGGTS